MSGDILAWHVIASNGIEPPAQESVSKTVNAVADLDPDTEAYVTAVETADGQSLEPEIISLYDDFVRGVKADGNWAAINASCILAGARTLNGALTPLVGPAPTPINFVESDYSRAEGLKGAGDTEAKALNINRDISFGSTNSKHVALYLTDNGTVGSFGISHGSRLRLRIGAEQSGFSFNLNANSTDAVQVSIPKAPGFAGITRSDGTTVNWRVFGQNGSELQDTGAPQAGDIFVFAHDNEHDQTGTFSDFRTAWYSNGDNVDLAAMQARLDMLVIGIQNFIGVAPTITGSPEINGVVAPGETVQIVSATAEGAPTPTVTDTLLLDGMDVTLDIEANGDYLIPETASDGEALTLTSVASNGVGQDAEESISVTVEDVFTSDIDVVTLIEDIEAESGQLLEEGVKVAYDNFIKNLKSDGIWAKTDTLMAVCAAPDLNSSMIPIKGSFSPGALTVNNFVEADYDRKTGLKGGSGRHIVIYTGTPSSTKSDAMLAANITDFVPDDIMVSREKYSKINSIHSSIEFQIGGDEEIDYGMGIDTPGLRAVRRISETQIRATEPGRDITRTDAYLVDPQVNLPFNRLVLFGRINSNGVYKGSNHSRMSHFYEGVGVDEGLLQQRIDEFLTAIDAAIA